MKRTSLLLSLLLCTLWATAQTYPSQSTNQDTNQVSNQTKVQGCLNESNGNYTLTDSAGNSFQLTGDTSQLKKHVGHQVQVTGTTSSSNTTTGTTPEAQTNENQSGAQQTLNVTSVKHIASSCSASR